MRWAGGVIKETQPWFSNNNQRELNPMEEYIKMSSWHRCNYMILSGNIYPWKIFTAKIMNQIGLERSARWSCSLGDQLTGREDQLTHSHLGQVPQINQFFFWRLPLSPKSVTYRQSARNRGWGSSQFCQSLVQTKLFSLWHCYHDLCNCPPIVRAGGAWKGKLTTLSQKVPLHISSLDTFNN